MLRRVRSSHFKLIYSSLAEFGMMALAGGKAVSAQVPTRMKPGCVIPWRGTVVRGRWFKWPSTPVLADVRVRGATPPVVKSREERSCDALPGPRPSEGSLSFVGFYRGKAGNECRRFRSLGYAMAPPGRGNVESHADGMADRLWPPASAMCPG